MRNKTTKSIKTEKIKYSLPTKKRKNLSISLIAISLIIVISVALFKTYQYQIQNRAEAAKITGSWYCVEEDIQYTFKPDSSFSATNGQQTLINGTWKVAWEKNILELDFESEGTTFYKSTPFVLNNENNQLELININKNTLTLLRLEDSLSD